MSHLACHGLTAVIAIILTKITTTHPATLAGGRNALFPDGGSGGVSSVGEERRCHRGPP